jgi:hypothetical protein
MQKSRQFSSRRFFGVGATKRNEKYERSFSSWAASKKNSETLLRKGTVFKNIRGLNLMMTLARQLFQYSLNTHELITSLCYCSSDVFVLLIVEEKYELAQMKIVILGVTNVTLGFAPFLYRCDHKIEFTA